MKKIISLLAICIFFQRAYSQKIQVGAGFGLGSMLTQGLGLGTGFGISGKYFLKPNMAIGLDYSSYGAAITDMSDTKVSISPLMITGDYYLAETQINNKPITPYLGFGLGTTSLGIKETSIFGGSISQSYFGIQPKAGVQYELNESLVLDVSVVYSKTFVSSKTMDATGFLGLKVGIAYQFDSK